MMIALEALARDIGQHFADDAAQCVLGQEVVADEVSHRESARSEADFLRGRQ